MSTKPKQYLIKLYFSNLDENLHTKYQAHIAFPDTFADNEEHAKLLAERLEKVLGADNYEVI